MIIYKIICLINDKIYVGQTTQKLKNRWKSHKYFSRKRKSILYNAMRKYGIENFKIEELESCDTKEQLNEREIYWIKELNSKKPNGYNLTDGGEGSVGYHHTEFAKLNISKHFKNKPSKRKNYKHTQETKQKMYKKVYQYDLNDCFIKEFESIKAATIETKAGHICQCCKNIYKSSGGFRWKYKKIT